MAANSDGDPVGEIAVASVFAPFCFLSCVQIVFRFESNGGELAVVIETGGNALGSGSHCYRCCCG